MSESDFDGSNEPLIPFYAWNAVVVLLLVTFILAVFMWWVISPTILLRWQPDPQTICVVDKFNFAVRCYPTL